MNNNPFGFGPGPGPRRNPQFGLPNGSVDQLYAQYKQMEAQLAQQQQFDFSNPAMSQRGLFMQVKDYKEVDNYPVPTDGTPTLFFDFANMVFYSKKFANGQSCIQGFVFAPMNGGSPEKQQEPAPAPTQQPVKQEPQIDPVLTAIFEKLDEISSHLAKPDVQSQNQARIRAKAGETK